MCIAKYYCVYHQTSLVPWRYELYFQGLYFMPVKISSISKQMKEMSSIRFGRTLSWATQIRTEVSQRKCSRWEIIFLTNKRVLFLKYAIFEWFFFFVMLLLTGDGCKHFPFDAFQSMKRFELLI